MRSANARPSRHRAWSNYALAARSDVHRRGCSPDTIRPPTPRSPVHRARPCRPRELRRTGCPSVPTEAHLPPSQGQVTASIPGTLDSHGSYPIHLACHVGGSR